MHSSTKTLAPIFALIIAISFGFVSAASALTASCVGVPTATNITWTATVGAGVAPFAYLWGNGATTSPQTAAGVYGLNTMNLQVTDASSTVATSTCSTIIAQPVPTITSFTATPSTINAGQSSVLTWNVTNASSTSLNNGLGTISSTSVTVAPAVSTTYTLSATNPGGTVTANVLVTVGTTSTSTGSTGGSTVPAQILVLLNQIAALKAQLALLLSGGTGGTGGTSTSTPMCFNFWRDLKKGDFGDDVKELQQSLAHSDPTLFPPGLVNGFFGPKTEAALKMWQKRYGISSSSVGYFGPLSRNYFKKNCGKKFGDDYGHSSSSKSSTSSKQKSSDDNDDDGKGKGSDNGKGKGNSKKDD
jgi:hypothetical protein